METNILDLLEKTTDRYGNKTAIKDINGSCTFAELKCCVDKIGSVLIGRQIFGKTIPVFMEKGIATLETFLGIVSAGGCYCFLNPIQPKERLESILRILEAPIVITDRMHLETLQNMEFSGEIVLSEELREGNIDKEGLRRIRLNMIDTDPLYVNFTSGSTGIPKGVVVPHKSVIEFIHYFTDIFEITEKDIIGNQAPFDFDVSVKDIYSTIMTGATLYLIPREQFSFPQKLLDTLESEQITTLIWAVSALCVITSLKGFRYKIPPAVNKVLFSGEVMPVNHLKEWMRVLPDAKFVNLYGPTEITCNCTYYVIESEPEENEVIPIGKAFPNERVFLLDENGREVLGEQEAGEVCVAGSTLALGYFKNREKTSEAFVQNPLHNIYNELVYRTGDMAYYRGDGNLVYIGRKDFQIKHLGHRIELGEIESHMNAVSEVDRVCCLYDEEKKQIVAFYQGKAEKKDIKEYLRKKVMKYMIPEKIINIEKMPITANGKIDRKNLREKFL